MSDATVRAVRHRIATAILPPLPPATLGEVQLLPHQRRAAARLHRILDHHHGALLADAVGLGKTFSALAVAQRYREVAVLAPAALVAMWEAALLRTRQRHVTVRSLHRASYRRPQLFAHGEAQSMTNRLVIIDEAHALRNRHTTRYRHVAEAVLDSHVLLLSATPLHNRPEDLTALFALFRGTQADALRHDTLAALIVRREHVDSTSSTRDTAGAAAGVRAAPPRLRTHRPLTVPQNQGTLERLLALPAPLPAREGAAAGALIRLGLLRAWCSSDAALTQALTTRLQRGAALRAALEAGRHPTPQELRSWVIDDQAGTDMQLGFAELLVAQAVDGDDHQRRLLDTLTPHTEALRELRSHHVRHARADAVRAACLRAIRRRHPSLPVVAFSQHGRTVRALFRALSDIAGVGMLTGHEARIASGPVSRPELLGWFAPRAQGRPPPPPHRRVTLLLATDLIAEGVNLQDAGVVVHLDLPWTHATRTQRTGRVRRLGAPHHEVHEYRLRAMPSARRLLRIEQRLARKAALTERFVGDREKPRAPGLASVNARRSAADLHSTWTDRLEQWALEPAGSTVQGQDVLRTHTGLTGALVMVRGDSGVHTLAIVQRDERRWWVSTRAQALLAVSEGEWPTRLAPRPTAITDRPRTYPSMTTGAVEPCAALARAVRGVVRRWWLHTQARHAAGVHATADQPSCIWSPVGAEPTVRAPFNGTQQQAMRWLQMQIAEWSALQRAQRAVAVTVARARIAAARGAGGEAALRRWMAVPHTSPEALLAGWSAHAALRDVGPGEVMHASRDTETDRRSDRHDLPPIPRIEACLYVLPG